MKIALVNPPWRFEHSIYFGCREPHLPLELGASKVLLERAGHTAQIFDAHLFGLSMREVADDVAKYQPDITVVTTAPSYLFWRCAPPELTIPQAFLAELGTRGGITIAVGPHGSVTPEPVLRKLRCDHLVMGECEEALVDIVQAREIAGVAGVASRIGGQFRRTGGPRATRFTDLPPIVWPREWIARHHHHHHRFESQPVGPGAEVEASRGCPYSCSFCAKNEFRDRYRRRDVDLVIAEVDGLIANGARYVYFIDEIFLPQKPLLEALVQRPVQFGIQTRIDLWKPDMLDLLGRAGCVSIEAGVESLTAQGRDLLDKNCKLSTDELTERLIHARSRVPFVQANLIETAGDEDEQVQAWRARLNEHGVWANDPVPLFPYPSSPDYHKLFGMPDDLAWERAHAHYLRNFDAFSDIQESTPLPLHELEAPGVAR